ncbi:MAG: DUF4292 domain-containing protein [Muribaculaceae bacterium]|nr:DUF4292 domain-containing protein [Muribaculaceae bacterium]
MMKSKVKYLILAAMALTAFLPSCKATHSTTKSDSLAVVDASNVNNHLNNYEKSFKVEGTHNFKNWKDLSIPFKLRLTAPKSMSVSGRATMVWNKSIQLSFRVLGLEVAKVVMRQDSIFAMEKIKSRYVAESMSKLKKDFPVKIEGIQVMLLGRGLPFFSSYESVALVPEVVDDSHWKMSFDNLQPFLYSFVFSADDKLTEFDGELKSQQVKVKIDYSDHFETPYGIFPSTAKATIKARKQSYAAMLQWNFASARWDSGAVTSWTTPSGYKRISSDQLLNMLPQK